MKRRLLLYKLSAVLVICLLVVLVCSRYLPKPPLSSLYPYSTAIYARQGELLRLTLAKDGQYRIWVPLAAMPANLRKATLLYEDRWFYRHYGINPWALLRSVWMTYAQGSRQGASTITMQLARQIYHINSRHPWGKLWQCAAAIWLELRYNKDQLLEAYLNTAPYSGNISGVAAASLIYFHKPVSQLGLSEALTLAVIPQNPVRRAPSRNSPQALLDARQRLWQRWLQHYPQDQRWAVDFNLPLSVYSRADKPFLAPHLTDSLLHEYPADLSITSSINLPVQKAVKQLLDGYIVQNSSAGVHNAAVLVLDADTMQVQALVGSANYSDRQILGQVNGVMAKRSPGSSLKPFVYALALDQGLLHPRTILKDTPTAFGAFNPENFDGKFIGPVTVQDALVRSRNIPALTVAAELAKPSLYEFLVLSGISGLDTEQHYGLSLSLGSGDVTMEELVKLYAMLANRGVLRDVQYRVDLKQQAQPKLALLSEAAAFITWDMLSNNVRPDSKRRANPKVAWKTGTSWGFKDAWAVGVVGRTVLAVWVGNFDNSGNTAFVGIQTAAPLFFSIIDSLRSQRLLKGLDSEPVLPLTVTEIEVCAASGDLPNQDCPALAKTWFIPGKSPIKTSNLHRAVYFDNKSGAVVCKDSPDSHKEVYEFWSSDLYRLFLEAGLPRRRPPPLPSCYDNLTGKDDSVQIVSPSTVGTYTLRLSKPSSIGLRANSPTAKAIFWFANKSFVGKTAASETLSWQPSYAGKYYIRAVDNVGHADAREITVELLP
ncbi:MAG: penicillin-binding protein 1C [Methylococcales bacterium]|nr:penicillin-binding protein 1C [Methylococcales bacterium]